MAVVRQVQQSGVVRVPPDREEIAAREDTEETLDQGDTEDWPHDVWAYCEFLEVPSAIRGPRGRAQVLTDLWVDWSVGLTVGVKNWNADALV